MNPLCRSLLVKLLNSWQSAPDKEGATRLPITEARAPLYFSTTLAADKDALHAGLQEAKAAALVNIEWGKRYESHLIKRITLLDGPGLARFLSMPLATCLSSSARDVLVGTLSGKVSWIEQFVDHLVEQWRHNRPVVGIAPGEIEQAQSLIKALEAVSAGRHLNLDLRTFSVREFGDSKAMESMLSRFATVWKKYNPSDLSNDEFFAALGLTKFPHPILIRGPIILNSVNRDINCTGIVPYIGIPPQTITGATSAGGTPAFVLTIENYASFNRYTSEISDNGLIIYTAGFPSPGVSKLIRLLDTLLPSTVPFYHWGDIDEGGLKIFGTIAAMLQRTLYAHQMTPEVLASMGKPAPGLRIKEIEKLAQNYPLISNLATAILSTSPPRVLEQEFLDPASPSA
jgi:hypothetical protein